MRHRFRPLVLLPLMLLFARSAAAGPPLLCHPFDTGGAASLPWSGPGWPDVDPRYDVTHLTDDTLALLTPQAPVLARMETLRRATVYARSNPAAAAQLLARLHQRMDRKDHGSREYALALFDAGYLAETYKQAAWISANSREKAWKFDQLSPGGDGYGQITRAAAMTGDPAMAFAAAVVAKDRRVYGETAYQVHLRHAIAGAPDGSLLSRNLVTQFGDEEIRQLRSVAGSRR
jgi:hypothetical protein